MSEMLRKLAQQLRESEAQRVSSTNEKCAQIVAAATGLELLHSKLRGSNVA